MTVVTDITSILQSIATLGGSFGPLLHGHSAAVRQANNILDQVNSAASENNWQQVLLLSNSLFSIQGLSTAALNDVRSLATAAQNAGSSSALFRGGTGINSASAVEIATLNANNQQLVLSQANNLRMQLQNESASIWQHMRFVHALTTTGTTTS